MFRCPVCDVEFQRLEYEGFPVLRCHACLGYLISRNRMESVRRVQATSVSQLQDEALAEKRDDTNDPLKCPRCRGAMRKEFIEEPASFFIDTCRACELVWFDGGELARLQLSYEISPKGREAAEYQRRMREMTVEQREQFERNLALLPKGDASVLSGFGATLLESLLRFFHASP